MKLLFLLLLLPACIHAQKVGIGVDGYTTSTDSHGRLIDSANGKNYFVWNCKKVPAIGVYADTSIWKDPYGSLYLVDVFYNQRQIVEVAYYQLKGEMNRFHVTVDDKIKLKK